MSTDLAELQRSGGHVAVLGSNERRRYVDMQDCLIYCDVLHHAGSTFAFEPTGTLTPFFFQDIADVHGWQTILVEVPGKDPYELANAVVEQSSALLVFSRTGKPHAADDVLEYAIAYALSLGIRVVRVPRLTHQAKEQNDDVA